MTKPTNTDPVRAWQHLSRDAASAAPSMAPSMAAAMAAALRLADLVWRQVAADPTLNPSTALAVPGEASFARTALAAFEHLYDSGAYAHLDRPAPLRCWADPSRLHGWLTSPSDLPGFSMHTVADTWGISEDQFDWEAEGIGARMGTLVEAAQHAGVFGVPGYTITLRQVATDDPAAEAIVEHQVTLRTPTGATLASAPMAADHLADDDLSGVDAAVAVLANTAVVVNELLDDERQLATTAATVAAAPHAPTGARPGRGFTPLDLSTPAIAAVEVEPPRSRPDRHPRR